MRPSRIVLALCLALMAIGLTACSVSYGVSHKIDHKKAETFLSKFVKTNLKKAPKSVTCPSGIKEVKGGTFKCTLVLADGEHVTATIHMTDDSGSVHVAGSDFHDKN